jgi:tellurite resistance protein
VHRRRPDLFGQKTRAVDAAEMQSAVQTVNEVLAALRTTPPLLVALAAEYDVRLRPDADSAKDLLDAAVAAAR